MDAKWTSNTDKSRRDFAYPGDLVFTAWTDILAKTYAGSFYFKVLKDRAS